MLIKTSLTNWMCVVTIGLCANIAHASEGKKEEEASYSSKCTDKLYGDYLYCLGAKAAYSASRDDLGTKSFTCPGLTRSQVEDCSKRNGEEIRNHLSNKKIDKK